MFQCCISRALNGNFNGSLGPCLTLSAHYNEGDICYIAVCAQLAVVVVDLLEAGLVLQAEDQDHTVYPATELQAHEEEGTEREVVHS